MPTYNDENYTDTVIGEQKGRLVFHYKITLEISHENTMRLFNRSLLPNAKNAIDDFINSYNGEEENRFETELSACGSKFESTITELLYKNFVQNYCDRVSLLCKAIKELNPKEPKEIKEINAKKPQEIKESNPEELDELAQPEEELDELEEELDELAQPEEELDELEEELKESSPKYPYIYYNIKLKAESKSLATNAEGKEVRGPNIITTPIFVPR